MNWLLVVVWAYQGIPSVEIIEEYESMYDCFYGFELYEDIDAPEYDGSLNKIPFASQTSGRSATVLFLVKRCAKARGSAIAYQRNAKEDPENRKTVLGFDLYFIAIPTSLKGQGAIVSGTVV